MQTGVLILAGEEREVRKLGKSTLQGTEAVGQQLQRSRAQRTSTLDSNPQYASTFCGVFSEGKKNIERRIRSVSLLALIKRWRIFKALSWPYIL